MAITTKTADRLAQHANELQAIAEAVYADGWGRLGHEIAQAAGQIAGSDLT